MKDVIVKKKIIMPAEEETPLTGAQKAAIFLKTLDKPVAKKVVKLLQPSATRRIMNAMQSVKHVSKLTVQSVLQESWRFLTKGKKVDEKIDERLLPAKSGFLDITIE